MRYDDDARGGRAGRGGHEGGAGWDGPGPRHGWGGGWTGGPGVFPGAGRRSGRGFGPGPAAGFGPGFRSGFREGPGSGPGFRPGFVPGERPEFGAGQVPGGPAGCAGPAGGDPEGPDLGEGFGRRGRGFGPPRGGFGPGGFGPGGLGFGMRGAFGPPGPGFGMRRGGHGHRRRMRGDVRSAVLALLAEEPRHGYAIMSELTERSGGLWRPSPGSVYPVLQQLQDEGLVSVEEAEGRRVFSLTEHGRSYVEEHREQIGRPWELADSGPGRRVRTLAEGMAGLGAAVHQVAQLADDAQAARAAAALEEARRTMYRILAGDDVAGPATPSGTRAGTPAGAGEPGSREPVTGVSEPAPETGKSPE